MSRHDKNIALRRLLDEAEMSNSALGRAVVAAGAGEGKHLGRDMRRRKFLLGSVFSATAFSEPALFALS